jgi:hypothetical protein
MPIGDNNPMSNTGTPQSIRDLTSTGSVIINYEVEVVKALRDFRTLSKEKGKKTTDTSSSVGKNDSASNASDLSECSTKKSSRGGLLAKFFSFIQQLFSSPKQPQKKQIQPQKKQIQPQKKQIQPPPKQPPKTENSPSRPNSTPHLDLLKGGDDIKDWEKFIGRDDNFM